MKYSWIDTELLQKSGVNKDLQAEWNWIRYHIGGKMFAAVCLDDATGKPVYITCKLDPAEGEFLRKQYEDIIPGYYMNKVHWNSVKADGNVPDALLRFLRWEIEFFVFFLIIKRHPSFLLPTVHAVSFCLQIPPNKLY